ncbi:MAG: DUF523 and DUF1722 domain-containing protein [Myxococcota bacterium]
MQATREAGDEVWRAWHDEAEPIRVAVSACLLGAEVRFDGGHKRDRYLTDVLDANVIWVPVCPEIEAGMGIPRPVVQLRGGEEGDRLVVRGSGEDWTTRMEDWARPRVGELLGLGLDGFVLKKDSPSCGAHRVRVYDEHVKDGVRRTGVGLFARAVRDAAPDLPLEEEGRLHDPVLRERFIEAVFCSNRWRVYERRGPSRRGLVAFHEAHKFLLLAHDEGLYRELGRWVGRFGQVDDREVHARYRALFFEALRRPATVSRHVNVLEHLFGYLKRVVTPIQKREIAAAIEDYRAMRVPLVVPITLLRFLVHTHEVDYVRGQLYLEPHPRELMLRNHV